MKSLVPWSLLGISVIVAVIFVGVASQRHLTALEGAALQCLTLLSGLAGSFIAGRNSAHEAARELIKPHARSAFRRLLSLFRSLSRMAFLITETKQNQEVVPPVLDTLEAILEEQIATADDALEDWSDIVPDDVEELKERLEAAKQGGRKND